MRVLVTGAGGYIGQAVTRALLVAGHDVVAMLRDDSASVPDGVEIRLADLVDPGALAAAMASADAVCHLAGLTRARESVERPLDYYATNVGGTVELLRAMDAAGVGQFVFASTGAIYGTPEKQPMSEDLPDVPPHPYASSKAAAEAVAEWETRRRNISSSALRLFNAAGGRDPDPTRLIPRVIAAVVGDGPPLGVNGDGSAVRDYLHIDDAADAFVAAIACPSPAGELRRFNIGSGIGSSIADVLAATERVVGRAAPVQHNPPVAEPPALVCDPSRAAAELGWKPRKSQLETILRDAWEGHG